ncbi:MAG TPA: hypothetical protein VFG54_10425 [Prolixibacteraceae bacterium]|nr:hypothetical protein [Prolixibacteraceae bacterium]
MKTLHILKVIIPFIAFGCSQVNNNDVWMEFEGNSRQLTVQIMASAIYITKLDTIIKQDTLELMVYEKPVGLTFKEEKKKASRTIILNENIHFIKHKDKVHATDSLYNKK